MSNLNSVMEKEKQFHMGVYERLPVCFVKGKGAKLWDTEGKEYLDLVAGLGVASLGHSHPAYLEALKNQAQNLMQVSNLFYNLPQLELAEKLKELFGGGKCFFANSGAEANEGAVKLARKWAKENLNNNKYEAITAFNSFHGRTLAMVAATGQPEKQKPYEPLPLGFKHVPLNNLSALEEAVTDKTCAVMLEPIQGEGGVYPCEEEYLREVRKLCDQNQVLLIFDEVQTGMGRTGKMFAFENFGVKPDIITLAKGLGNGFPIGAIIAKEEIATAFKTGDHGSTFGGNPLACVSASATLKILEEEKAVEKARKVGNYFIKRLAELKSKNSVVKEVRGIGLMIGLELNKEIAKEVVLRCLNEGLVINSIGKNILRFLPSFLITKEEVDQALTILEPVLE